MLVSRAKIRPGQDLLIQAAGSGVGSAAIQIGKMFGARIIATAGSDSKVQKAKDLGADIGINYNKEDFAKVIREVTSKRGVDIAMDHVGEPTISRSIASLAKGGTLVTCGATGGFRLETDIRLIFFKSLSVLGSTMGSLGEVHEIMNLVGNGSLKPVIHKVLPMDKIKEAHRILGDREVFGKVIVTL